MRAALTVGNTRLKGRRVSLNVEILLQHGMTLRCSQMTKWHWSQVFPTQAEGIWLLYPFQPHVLSLLSLQGSPEAGSIRHIGVKQREKKKLSAKLEGKLDHLWIRYAAVQRRGGLHSQNQRREEQDCTFGSWFSRHGGVGLMVGLDDLRGLFQP